MAVQTFTKNYSGANSIFTVPAGIVKLTADLRGGKGGSTNSAAGGLAGRVIASFAVSPSQVLNCYVGQAGFNGGTGTAAGAVSYNGGGAGGTASTGFPAGAGGGGASDIRIGGTALANRVLVAGGGGGGADSSGGTGGAGGGTTGGTGSTGAGGVHPGAGGTQAAGGAAGSGSGVASGVAGSSGTGGKGGNFTTGNTGGGGGGGGYYGGGGGAGGNTSPLAGSPGGGGSNFIAATINGTAPTSVTNTQGFNSASPSIILSYYPAPNTPVPDIAIGTYFKQTPSGTKYAEQSQNQTLTWGYTDPSSLAQSRVDVRYRANGGAWTTITNAVTGTGSSYSISSAVLVANAGTSFEVQVMTYNSEGNFSPWSSSLTFIPTTLSAHTPSVILVSPASAVHVGPNAAQPFSWSFLKYFTDDVQSAYQIVVEDNNTGVSVYDSGKITSAATSRNVDTTGFALDTEYRWKVRVWSGYDVATSYTNYRVFTLNSPPSFTFTPVNASVIDTGTPTFNWSSVTFAPGAAQASWALEIKDTVANVVISTVSGLGQTSYTPPSPVLANGGSYQVKVTLVDTYGLSKTVTNTYTVAYVAPDSIDYTITAVFVDDLGYVDISWDADQADAQFVSWQVYSRDVDEDGDWELIYKSTDAGFDDYHYYLFKSGTTYQFNVTQVALRSGVPIESAVGFNASGPETATYLCIASQYWIINNDDEALSMKLVNVTGDEFTEEYEMETYTLIGRGRKTEYGTRLGCSGTLACQLKTYDETPKQVREKLEATRRSQSTYWLRSPFGDLFKISIGIISYSRTAGTGTVAMYDVSIPYTEIA